MQELVAVMELVVAEMLPHSRQRLLCSYWNRNKCMCRPRTNSMTTNVRFCSLLYHMRCHTRQSLSDKQAIQMLEVEAATRQEVEAAMQQEVEAATRQSIQHRR